MPLAETLAVLLVAAVIAALMAGYPVALTLAGVSLAFALARPSRRRHGSRAFSARCRTASSAS